MKRLIVWRGGRLARAHDDARRAGLQATGFNADRRPSGRVMRRLQMRETAARVKTLLGARIPITGDGRRSWGP